MKFHPVQLHSRVSWAAHTRRSQACCAASRPPPPPPTAGPAPAPRPGGRWPVPPRRRSAPPESAGKHVMRNLPMQVISTQFSRPLGNSDMLVLNNLCRITNYACLRFCQGRIALHSACPLLRTRELQEVTWSYRWLRISRSADGSRFQNGRDIYELASVAKPGRLTREAPHLLPPDGQLVRFALELSDSRGVRFLQLLHTLRRGPASYRPRVGTQGILVPV